MTVGSRNIDQIMNDGLEIPDSILPYLDEIAERLWSDRAAVMVGAGFSKNAGEGFPDWNQLGELFYHKAHGVYPDLSKKKYLNVLRIAEEVEAAIGRPALENLLRSNIPDLSIEPSGLHVDLLEFPWVDVFTTNYDTLLERASAKVVTRRYEPVVNKGDLPYAIKPRIVKLHGSFPSERPFIITEEDYRRYPYDYAPFVNTVQQSLLENTFCLVGFSGDDPNFLQWIGWIRDNLGRDKSQKIYLVGSFDLSSARLQLLAQRGIIVVDFSCCHGIEKHDHKKTLSRFFSYIRSKKPDALDWPYNPKTAYPAHGKDRIKEIQKITEEWRRQRQIYPGWLILPHANRENLWLFTEYWVNYLPDTEKFPPGLDIQYAFELIWRLERCLLPVFNNVAEFCEKLIEKYWPFQGRNPSQNCSVYLEDIKSQDLPWAEIRHAWFSIYLAMLRFYREEGFLDKWKEAELQLTILSEYLSAEQREFLNYEGFLFYLFTLDIPNAKKQLENWSPNEALPYWIAKRASGLAEIGLLSEAERTSIKALENIRKKLNQKIGVSDISLVSLESNAVLLGKYIQGAASFERGERRIQKDKRLQFNDKWNELKGFKYDPWTEIKLFELILKNPPVQRKTLTEKRGFDIGRISQTCHFSRSYQEEIGAYSFLRFCEEIGLPYRIGNYIMATKIASASLQHICQSSLFWAIATLARLGEVEAVDSLFSRQSVYRFTSDEADQLIKIYLESLKKCQDDIHLGDALQNDTYGVRLAKLLPEVMSRLCCKCSFNIKRDILFFVRNIYASPDKIKYRNIKNLIKRLMSSISEVEQYKLVPELLKIPFPEDLDLLVKNDFPNPFSLMELKHKPEGIADLEIQSELIDLLLRQAMLNNSTRRRWAITSLAKLYNLQELDNNQSKSFAIAIWNETDRYDLPESTDFYKFAFLVFPHPEDIEPQKIVKNYIKSKFFSIQEIAQENEVLSVIHEIIGSNRNDEKIWTEEDVEKMLEYLFKCWNTNKNILSSKTIAPRAFLSRSNEFREMLELLVEVILPKLSIDLSEEMKTSLRQFFKKIQDYGLQTLTAEAACLHIYPTQKDDVYNRIKEAIISNREDIQRDGLRAIGKIINDDEVSVGIEPISMLSQYLTWCPIRSISPALWLIVHILENAPTNFSKTLEIATQRCLGRLLTDTAYDKDLPDLNFEEKLEIRHIASNLAAILWKYYSSNRLDFPEVVEKWHKIGSSPDEFSEIKNPWSIEDIQK